MCDDVERKGMDKETLFNYFSTFTLKKLRYPRDTDQECVLRNRFETFNVLWPQQNLVQLYQTILKIRMSILKLTDYLEIKINPPPLPHDVNASFPL